MRFALVSCLINNFTQIVIPAEAGIQYHCLWIPVCTGMTKKSATGSIHVGFVNLIGVCFEDTGMDKGKKPYGASQYKANIEKLWTFHCLRRGKMSEYG